MDWTLVITRNRDALLRIVAGLFTMAGLAEGKSVLPRHIYFALLRVLRPAESAARRLIVIEAQTQDIVLSPSRPSKARAGTSLKSAKAQAVERQARLPAFRLIDPRKRFNTRPRRKGPGPRIWVIGYDDSHLPLIARRQAAAARAVPPPPPSPDDPVGTDHLYRRLKALKHALDDLPAQAKRLARLEARRAQAPPGPRRIGPLRPGWPPGYRKRHIHPVDQILYDCHALAHRAFAQQTRPSFQRAPPSRGSFFA